VKIKLRLEPRLYYSGWVTLTTDSLKMSYSETEMNSPKCKTESGDKLLNSNKRFQKWFFTTLGQNGECLKDSA